jgi:hypothetical protein
VIVIGNRLMGALNWGGAKEEFVDDSEANALLSRAPRLGYEAGT